MTAVILSIWCTLILSCLLSHSFTAKARPMGLNPHTIHAPQEPAIHDHKNEVGSFFQDPYMRRSSTMKKKRLPISPAENKLVATQFKVSVQGSHGHNQAQRIKKAETFARNDSGTQIFSRHRNESKNESAPAMRKDITVNAFRPASSGHSPGAGHDNPPDRRL